jgi:hypothetical protein
VFAAKAVMRRRLTPVMLDLMQKVPGDPLNAGITKISEI